MQSPILGSSYVARSVNAAANRMVNLFSEATPEGGQTQGFLQRAPGLRLLQTVGDGPIRGEWTFSDKSSFYVVSGTELYRSTSAAGPATLIGTVTGTGPVSMADNGIQLFIACDPDGFIYNQDTAAFGQITDPDFPGAVTVAYIDNFFLFNEPDSQRLWVTQLLDGTSIDPLDFSSVDGNPDGVKSVIVDHREAWIGGPNSMEVWYNAGLPDFPLARIQGAYIETGIVSPYAICKADNTIFWLSQDERGQGMVFRANGYTPERVSTHAVEWQIQQYASISDAIFYSYQQDGHTFVVCIFPQGDVTWVYDCATKLWHERAGWDSYRYVRHRSNCQCNFNGTIIVGDYENGNLYALDQNTYDDNGVTQRWLRAWRALPPGTNDLNRQTHHNLQINAQTGVGLPGLCTDPLDNALATEGGDYIGTEDGFGILVSVATVQGACPLVSLRWSDDGGHNWSNYHVASLGAAGKTGHRAFYRRMGMTEKLRDRVYELTGSDPVKIAIMGAELDVTPTKD